MVRCYNSGQEVSSTDLTDAQWKVVVPYFGSPKVREDGKGRPWTESREVLNGILWVLRTGAPWKDLPDRYPSYQTCHRRFQAWEKEGVMILVLQALARDLEERGAIDMSECFIDGTFASAKKGAVELVRQSAVKGPRSWRSQTALVFLSESGLEALRLMK
jgi:transposase